MGWLSTLAKIGLVGAAPFTGGATLAGIPAVDAIGKIAGAVGGVSSVLGKQQEGKAAGAVAQANATQAQDRNAISLYQAQQAAQNQQAQTDLQRKQAESTNRSTTAQQALVGKLLGGGMTPTTIKDGQVSGGLLRSLNANPDALAALKLLGQQGSDAQNTPLDFQGGGMVAAPKLTGLPDTGGGLMSTLANIGQLVGAASPYLKGSGDPGASTAGIASPGVSSIGSMPGGSVVPRTVDPRLTSRNIYDLDALGG